MRAPIHQLKKEEIQWLATHYCRHSHTYLEHYSCYLKEVPEGGFIEKIGFFDIETTGRSSEFDFILSYAIKEARKKKILGRTIKREEIEKRIFDKNLIKEMISDLRKFHRIVVHWGADKRFDLPFSRTRALIHGLEFPLYKEIYVVDTWAILKNKFSFSRNRLGWVCEQLKIPAKNYPLNPRIHQRASLGDEKALKYVWKHNVEDVVSLELLYERIKDYALIGKRSI